MLDFYGYDQSLRSSYAVKFPAAAAVAAGNPFHRASSSAASASASASAYAAGGGGRAGVTKEQRARMRTNREAAIERRRVKFEAQQLSAATEAAAIAVAVATAATAIDIQVGVRVRVNGMVSATSLNNLTGRVIARAPAVAAESARRWLVRIDSYSTEGIFIFRSSYDLILHSFNDTI